MQHVPKHNEEEHKAREEHHEQIKVEKTGKKNKVWIIAGVALLVIASVAAFTVLSPGQYDKFAKCLSEKGAVMYGEDWCPYTSGQKAMFGKSFKHVNYVIDPNLKERPTWVIDGESYETVQSFERLSALTGCEL